MSKKNIICLIISIVLAIVSFYLYSKELYQYMIITAPLLFIAVFFAFKGVGGNKTPEDSYNNFLKEIMKTYDAVLVDVVDLPNVDGRSLVKVSNFDDLIDAQIEIRKPIYFKRDDRSALFILLDDKQVIAFILKVSDNEKSQFDNWLVEQEKAKEKFDAGILADIENTTIVKLDNNKSYRISPIRENYKKTIKNTKDIEDTLSSLPKLKDTMEVSKTQMFKNLNKRTKTN